MALKDFHLGDWIHRGPPALRNAKLIMVVALAYGTPACMIVAALMWVTTIMQGPTMTLDQAKAKFGNDGWHVRHVKGNVYLEKRP